MAIVEQDYQWVGGGAGIRPTRNGQPSIGFPENGMGVFVSAPADTSWSSWVELTPGKSFDCVLECANVVMAHRETRDCFIQLGVGNTPVPIAEYWEQCSGTITGNLSTSKQYCVNQKLPVNTPLYFRIRSRVACTPDYNIAGVAVMATEDPPEFSENWDEESYKNGGVYGIELIPVIPNFTSVVSGAIDGWGNWVRFINSASNRLLVVGANLLTIATPPPPYSMGHLMIGINQVGQEVASFPKIAANSSGGGNFYLPRPVEVLPGEAVDVCSKAGKASQIAQVSLLIENLNF